MDGFEKIKILLEKFEEFCLENAGPAEFDFPEYGGLPEQIWRFFTSGCVDVIQEHLYYEESYSKLHASLAQNLSLNQLEESLEGFILYLKEL
jgi:hypothetical protein